MIISRTPFRISFVGGGSDLPIFYRKSAGRVISATIDKYVYIASNKHFNSEEYLLRYSSVESVASAELIRHDLFRAIIQRIKSMPGIEVNSIADIPAGTGLGSSSSFCVGTLLNLLTRERSPICSDKALLAQIACDVEIIDLCEPIGKQDQYAASFGGFNIYEFNSDDTVSVSPVNIPSPNELLRHLRLYYLGKQRSASSILSEQNREIETRNKHVVLQEMVNLVNPFCEAVSSCDWSSCGKLMNENWLLKKTLASGISDSFIQDVYEQGLKAGALGGKVLGAGGGGFMLFFIAPEKHELLDLAMKNLRKVSFGWDSDGAKIVYNDEAQ